MCDGVCLQERAAVAERRRAAARRARPLAGHARRTAPARQGGAPRRGAHAPYAPGDPGLTPAAPLHYGGTAQLSARHLGVTRHV